MPTAGRAGCSPGSRQRGHPGLLAGKALVASHWPHACICINNSNNNYIPADCRPGTYTLHMHWPGTMSAQPPHLALSLSIPLHSAVRQDFAGCLLILMKMSVAQARMVGSTLMLQLMPFGAPSLLLRQSRSMPSIADHPQQRSRCVSQLFDRQGLVCFSTLFALPVVTRHEPPATEVLGTAGNKAQDSASQWDEKMLVIMPSCPCSTTRRLFT